MGSEYLLTSGANKLTEHERDRHNLRRFELVVSAIGRMAIAKTAVTCLFARVRLLGSANAPHSLTHRNLPGDVAMMSSIVRRAVVALAMAPTLLARPLAAQNSQVALTDGGRRFLSPGMQGFELRRKSALGQFITDSTLRASSGVRLSHLIVQHMPSIRFPINGFAEEYPVSSRVCGGGVGCATPRCYVRIYLDGTLVFNGSPGLRNAEGVDLSHLRPEDFSGIEYYASMGGLPAQFTGTNPDCGTLLFWSRE